MAIETEVSRMISYNIGFMQSQGFVPNKEASICKSFSTEMEQRVAETGMQSTKDLLATKGRASFLGERAKGHIDPGARSSQLMIKTVCESVIQK